MLRFVHQLLNLKSELLLQLVIHQLLTVSLLIESQYIVAEVLTFSSETQKLN